MNEPLLNVVLVEPEIPPNAGNVGRLCAATRTRLHLVEPLGFKIDDKALKRAGLDYWEHLDWKRWPSLEALQGTHPGRYYFFTTKTKRLYTNVKYQRGDFLVFGRETKGLPEPLLAANADSCVTIPILHPEVRELNLATAAGIGLYEALRNAGSAHPLLNSFHPARLPVESSASHARQTDHPLPRRPRRESDARAAVRPGRVGRAARRRRSGRARAPL